MRRNQLVLYREPEHREILDYMEELQGGDDTHLFDVLNSLAELAARHGLDGNVWHDYLAFILAQHENAFSTTCEVRGNVSGSIRII